MRLKKRINKLLKPFGVELHGKSYLQALRKGGIKSDQYSFFKKIFGEEKIVIIDAGANRGLTISKFLEYFSSAKIYAFEAIPALCNDLKLRYSGNSNISAENCGIWDAAGSKTFFINNSLDTSSFLQSQKTGLNCDASVKNISSISVSVKSLSQIAEENKLNRIHILKLDIQGAELHALHGAEALLTAHRIDMIYTEAYFIQQYIDQPLFYDIADYLRRFGYSLQDIYNPIYGKGKLAWCDAVFVRNSLKLSV